MHLALLKFSVLRLAVFVASLGLLYLFGVRGFGLLVLAALVSLALSYILLARQRADLAHALEERVQHRHESRRPTGADADAAAEDGTAP